MCLALVECFHSAFINDIIGVFVTEKLSQRLVLLISWMLWLVGEVIFLLPIDQRFY